VDEDDQDLDIAWMRQALQVASEAGVAGEVPVGAVLVRDGVLVASGANRTIQDCDPSAHAEIIALRAGGRVLENHRLGGTLYVTLEPCVMCMGALVQARIERLVFGARDTKGGGAVSLYELGSDPRFNHRFTVTEGPLADESAALLRSFFRNRRRQAADDLRADDDSV
jgi:tRNA(adenine34) deaminase